MNQVGGDAGQRHDYTGEIDFAEHTRIGSEHIGGYVERGTEIIPQHDTCHVEQRLWYSVR